METHAQHSIMHCLDMIAPFCGLSNRAEIVHPDNRDVENAIYILRKYRGLAD